MSREYFTNEFLKHIQTTDSIMSTRGYKELCQEVLDTRTEIDHLIDDNTKFQEMAINKMTELRADNARLTAELAELRERFMVTDDLLNHATVTIGAVIACCTYNSNEDAKIGIYGISPDAFTRIDQFITRYNRAVSAGKVSVDVKPVQRPADPSLEEDE